MRIKLDRHHVTLRHTNGHVVTNHIVDPHAAMIKQTAQLAPRKLGQVTNHQVNPPSLFIGDRMRVFCNGHEEV